MYDIYDLTAFFFLMLLLMYWWRISEQKVTALTKARSHCKEREVQLLDQTLVFLRHRFVKDSRGQRHFCRVYEFDFSTDGEVRHKGEITMAGFSALRIILDAEQVEITDF